MLVVKKEFRNFSDAVTFLTKLGDAIGTPYLSFAGNNVASFIASYTKVQLSRRFNPYIGGINLELYFSQNVLELRYVSTSGTYVVLNSKFDNDMQVSDCTITVEIDESRCERGRGHYETITRMVYEYKWLDFMRDESDLVKVRINNGARKIGGNLLPVPNWVLDQRSNFGADVSLARELAKYGYIESSNVMFALKTFTNGDGSLVIEKYCPIWREDRFQIVAPTEKFYPQYWLSFRSLLLALKRAASKKMSPETFDEYDQTFYEDIEEDTEE